MNIDLALLGFDENFACEAALYPHLHVGRVVSQTKQLYRVCAGGSELTAQTSGRFTWSAAALFDFPVIGDFVMLDRIDTGGSAVIHHVLARKSIFVRKAAGTAHLNQPVAANIDTVFICMGMDRDFNIRRLERYLSITWSSGAVPVVVLTKSDLCDDITGRLNQTESASIGVDVIVTSALDTGPLKSRETSLGDNIGGVDALKPYIKGKTTAFLGSSGVGKSTLINCLAGAEILKTGKTSGGGRGRHVTTKREMIALCGGAVIDTPGMREIGIESADFSASFSDIEELAGNCRFSDCAHKAEPGCAVRKSVEDGTLDENRLANFLKLKKEAGYEGLNSRQIESMKITKMYAGFGGIKNARRWIKNKRK